MEIEIQGKNTVGKSTESMRNLCSFWLLGLLNNSCYVIMIAGANNISKSAVGLVYLCAVLPGILCKASAPYWFHLVPYSWRAVVSALLMVLSFLVVALTDTRGLQLVGVVFASLQSSLGEASCLALSSHFDSRVAITMWSSGTGFAGVFGYAWVATMHLLLGFTFEITLLSALVLPVSWIAVFFVLLESPDGRKKQLDDLFSKDSSLANSAMHALDENIQLLSENDVDVDQEILWNGNSILQGQSSRSDRKHTATERLTVSDRFRLVLNLWPYTVPLFLVYFAEYSMQSGVWPSIGFPVEDEAARHRFYVFGNWLYQSGVFLSRSSGTLWQAEKKTLWAMPIAQILFLLFFILVSIFKVVYNWWLLVPCFVTGLLGGSVYVNAFTLISRDVQPEMKEFSLAAASVADSSGIALADCVGIILQGCIFKANGLSGADFQC